MKVGVENRVKLGLMVALLLVAIYSVARWISGSAASPAANAAAPSVTPTSTRRDSRPARVLVKPRSGARRQSVLVASLDPTLRFDLLRSSESREYTGGGRNIFASPQEQIKIPQPKFPAVTPDPKIVENQGPPPPPPIPFKFYGFANKPGESKSIFLSSGDDVFIGREGEIVNRRYRIVHIGNTSVEIEDVLNNNRQTIPLTQG